MKSCLKRYAKLIAKTGGNVKKGDVVFIYADLDQPEFVALVQEQCYKLGAKWVRVIWSYPAITKNNSIYMSLEDLSSFDPYVETNLKYMSDVLPVRIHLISEDPDSLKGADQEKLSLSRRAMYPFMKPYLDKMEDRYKWCIAAVPGEKWAKKVFPELTTKQAVNKLWEAILQTSRAIGDPIKNWKQHNEFLAKQCAKLNELHLKELHYSSKNGTDFKVGLIPNALFIGGGEYTKGSHQFFNPNIPSEESFTSPMKGQAEGVLVATKPLSYNGQLIEYFSITFKDGKVSSVKAEKNQELLEKMVKMDEGASMLGEVALVPYDSPISNSGILFFNTLFDENASCHVALGRGFGTTIKDFDKYSQEEILKMGINESMIHVDFMVGTPDLSIVGTCENGEKVQIFKDGNWAI